MVKRILRIAHSCKERFGPQQSKTEQEFDKVIWATSFTDLIKLTHNDKSLMPKAQVVYKKQKSFKGMLTNYTQHCSQ